MTKFWKRLRKRFGPEIRYFYCGEYGERTGRPHYHAAVFNFEFPDKELWKTTYLSGSGKSVLYRSDILEELWPYGFSSIGELTFQSAAYVARYIMKKVTGDAAEAHYSFVDSDGCVYDRLPEFVRMSRKPGIGKGWIERYKTDVFPGDFCIVDGRKFRPPRYYDNELSEKEMNDIKRKRKRNAEKHSGNNTPERRRVREMIQYKKAERLMIPTGKDEL